MRKLLVGVLSVALLAFGLLFALRRPLHCPANRAACERIKMGMTRAEVEAALGGPPENYRTLPRQYTTDWSEVDGDLYATGLVMKARSTFILTPLQE
jgi:hypothetical protein